MSKSSRDTLPMVYHMCFKSSLLSFQETEIPELELLSKILPLPNSRLVKSRQPSAFLRVIAAKQVWATSSRKPNVLKWFSPHIFIWMFLQFLLPSSPSFLHLMESWHKIGVNSWTWVQGKFHLVVFVFDSCKKKKKKRNKTPEILLQYPCIPNCHQESCPHSVLIHGLS